MSSLDMPRDQQAQENAERISTNLDCLSYLAGILDENTNKQFWDGARQIEAMFKTLNPLLPEDREILWSRFQGYCQVQKEREYQIKEQTSRSLADSIIAQAREALPLHSVTYVVDESLESEPERLKHCGRKLGEAGRMLSQHKHIMLRDHKQECFRTIQATQQTLDTAWQDFKAKRDARRKHNFQASVRANLDTNKARLMKTKNDLSNCRASAEKLRGQIAASTIPDWKVLARGWLNGLETKIQDLASLVEKIESWIKTDEKKLQ